MACSTKSIFAVAGAPLALGGCGDDTTSGGQGGAAACASPGGPVPHRHVAFFVNMP